MHIRNSRSFLNLGVCLLACIVLVSVATVRLDSAGIQYDEVLQGADSFFYKDGTPAAYSRLAIKGFPVMTMSYQAAFMPLLYGAYLKFADRSFSVENWRLFAVFLMTLSMIVLGAGTCAVMPYAWTLAIFALLITDGTLLMEARYVGELGLALLLRMVFVVYWLRGLSRGFSKRDAFCAGLIVALAIFQKLSLVLLLVPLALILAFSGEGKFLKLRAALTGMGAGLIPLAAVNLYTWLSQKVFISLDWGNAVAAARLFSAGELQKFCTYYFTLGHGSILSFLVFNRALPVFWELAGVVALLALTAYAAYIFRGGRWNRLLVVSLLSYLGIGAGTYLIPWFTFSSQHMITGTPFQYLAFSFLLLTVFQGHAVIGKRHLLVLRILVVAAAALLVSARIVNTFRFLQSFRQDRYKPDFDPSLTAMGNFAARHADTAAFLAVDWGVATQIHCLGQGRPGLVREIYWEYRGKEELEGIIRDLGKDTVYLVGPKWQTKVSRCVQEIYADMRSLQGWEEAPAEEELAGLRAVRVGKFVRTKEP